MPYYSPASVQERPPGRLVQNTAPAADSGARDKVILSKPSAPIKLYQTQAPRSQDRTQAAAKGLSQLRQNDDTDLVPPNVEHIRAALKDRYSALGKEEADSIRLALRSIEVRNASGKGPQGGGDPDFLQWLLRIETAVEDPDNEDDYGPSFGHDIIGKFNYKGKLINLEAWGSAKNACRLLAGLLRLWAMSRAQIQRMGPQSNGPIVRPHLLSASQLLCDTFKISQSAATQSAQDSRIEAGRSGFGDDLTNTSSGAVEASSSSNTASALASATDKAGSSKLRNRVAMELKNGKVTEQALRSLSKGAALILLGSHAINGAKSSTKAIVLDMLVTAFNNGAIKPTASQVVAARSGISLTD
ncbi:hypothetical protein V8E36_005162 [Tilletia maclaganii]